jgi:HlyD family type I secretion membrane fusion protein
MNLCPSLDQWHRSVPSGTRGPILLGAAVLLICLGGFGVWAAVAPLDGAVVVSGSFVATGQNKQVQHLEGGIIREVLVQEGQLVEADQPLVRLDETSALTKLRRLVVRRHRLVIMKARLEAEISGRPSFDLPAEAKGDDAEVAAIVAGQKMELAARRARLLDEEQVLKKEIAGLQESITGLHSQIAATNSRLGLFAEELKDKTELLNRQLVRKTDVLAMRRAEAGLAGEQASLQARLADSRERISRAEQQIAQLRSAAMQKAIEELRATDTELDDVREQANAALDVAERSEVRAPVRGIVVKLNHHTRGGVVAAGAVILELLPANDDLIIEARLNPNDVAHVRSGLDALVRLTALNQRLTPMIDGKVTYLSADTVTQTDARARTEADLQPRHSFIVRVSLDAQDARAKVVDFRPTPGMPADVFIKTGERTFFEYIMKPVLDSFARAFREH